MTNIEINRDWVLLTVALAVIAVGIFGWVGANG